MVQTYKITITNASEVPRQFFLVHGVPSSESIADESAFDHAYQRSVKIMGDGTSSATFVLDDNYYAICGTKVGLSGGRPRVETSDSRPVRLGPNGSHEMITTIDKDGVSPAWAPTSGESTAVPGGFSISTDDSFTYPNKSKLNHGQVH